MSSLIASSKLAFNKTRWGGNPKLTQANYNEWKEDLILVLSALRAYAIVTRDHPESQPLEFVHNYNSDDRKA